MCLVCVYDFNMIVGQCVFFQYLCVHSTHILGGFFDARFSVTAVRVADSALVWDETTDLSYTNWESHDLMSMLSANSCFWIQSNSGLWKPGSCRNRTHGVICKRPRSKHAHTHTHRQTQTDTYRHTHNTDKHRQTHTCTHTDTHTHTTQTHTGTHISEFGQLLSCHILIISYF